MVTMTRAKKMVAVVLAAAVGFLLAACSGSTADIITGGDVKESPYGYSIAEAQKKLDAKALTSGVMDVKTWTKLQVFQRDKGLPVTGMLDPWTWKALGFDDRLKRDMKGKKLDNAIKWEPGSTVTVREVNEGVDGSQRWALERVLADITQITGIKFQRSQATASIPPNPLPIPDNLSLTLAWVQPGGNEVLGEDDIASSWLAVKNGRIKGGAGMVNLKVGEGRVNFGDDSTYAVLLKMMMNLMGVNGSDGIVIRGGTGLSGTITDEDIKALQTIYGVRQ